MNIITREEVEKMFGTLNSELDLSNIISVEDEELSKVLNNYLILKQYEQEIVANSSFTYEEILYSQYYWFVYFKNYYFSKFGYDGGMDQQAFLLIENITQT